MSCRTEGFCRSAYVCRILLDEVFDRRCRSTKQLTQHDGFVCRFCRVTASVRSVSKKRQATMPVRQSESSDSRPSDANFGFRKKRRQTSRRRHCSEGKAAKVQTPRFIPCLDLRMRCPRDDLQTGRETRMPVSRTASFACPGKNAIGCAHLYRNRRSFESVGSVRDFEWTSYDPSEMDILRLRILRTAGNEISS